MARMRTAAGVLVLIKELDPDSEVTMHFLRHLIKSGEIPVTPVGRKLLVDADAVIAYIAAGQKNPTEKDQGGPGKIRRVQV